MEELADSMTNLQRSLTIAELRKAIRDKKQVLLLNYESAHSDSTRSRLVEPQRFQDYFRYLVAFEPETAQNKIFKTDRIGEVKPTNRAWRYTHLHLRLGMDVFGMSGTQPVAVKLQLSRRAKQLLCEEFPDAANKIETKGKNHVFTAEVYGFAGIGRFVMGLLDEERHVDFLIRSSGLAASRVNALLVGLQLRRMVHLLPGGMVKRIEREHVLRR